MNMSDIDSVQLVTYKMFQDLTHKKKWTEEEIVNICKAERPTDTVRNILNAKGDQLNTVIPYKSLIDFYMEGYGQEIEKNTIKERFCLCGCGKRILRKGKKFFSKACKQRHFRATPTA